MWKQLLVVLLGCRLVAGSFCCWSGMHLLTKAEWREGLPKAFWEKKKDLMVSKKRKPNGTCLGPASLSLALATLADPFKACSAWFFISPHRAHCWQKGHDSTKERATKSPNNVKNKGVWFYAFQTARRGRNKEISELDRRGSSWAGTTSSVNVAFPPLAHRKSHLFSIEGQRKSCLLFK